MQPEGCEGSVAPPITSEAAEEEQFNTKCQKRSTTQSLPVTPQAFSMFMAGQAKMRYR